MSTEKVKEIEGIKKGKQFMMCSAVVEIEFLTK